MAMGQPLSLTRERWIRIEAILDEVLDLAPAERGARLDEFCRPDRALRAEADALLAADSTAAGDFLRVPAAVTATELFEPPIAGGQFWAFEPTSPDQIILPAPTVERAYVCCETACVATRTPGQEAPQSGELRLTGCSNQGPEDCSKQFSVNCVADQPDCHGGLGNRTCSCVEQISLIAHNYPLCPAG